MNLRQIEVFAAVAELGSLTRTAHALDMPQSLVSRNLSQLESTWGDRLFDRTGRGVVLTEFGQRMLPEVKGLLNQANRVERAVTESAGTLAGTVHIGVLPSISRQLLPLLFADVLERAPAVRLHVTEGFSGNLDQLLASGQLDMIVVNRYGNSALRGEDALGALETSLVGKPDHPALQAKTISFSKLAGLPLVLPSAPNGLRSVLEELSRMHATALNLVMEVDSPTAMKYIALSGHAMTLLPELAVRDEQREGLLKCVQVERPNIRRTISLRTTSQRPLSKAARFTASRLRELAIKLLRPAGVAAHPTPAHLKKDKRRIES